MHRRNPEEVRYLESGRPFWIPSGPFRVPGWVFPGAGSVVVLCHGWQGSAASWASLIPLLREAGFRVVVFNAPGHHYRPVRSSLPDFTQALRYVVETFGAEYLVGHSFGAMTTARVLGSGAKVKKAVLFSPPNRLEDLADGFCRRMGMSEQARAEFYDHLETSLPEGLARESVCHYLAGVETPMLLFHDVADEVVPASCSQKISAELGLPLVETEGLGHRKIIRDGELGRRVVEFLLGRTSHGGSH